MRFPFAEGKMALERLIHLHLEQQEGKEDQAIDPRGCESLPECCEVVHEWVTSAERPAVQSGRRRAGPSILHRYPYGGINSCSGLFDGDQANCSHSMWFLFSLGQVTTKDCSRFRPR